MTCSQNSNRASRSHTVAWRSFALDDSLHDLGARPPSPRSSAANC